MRRIAPASFAARASYASLICRGSQFEISRRVPRAVPDRQSMRSINSSMLTEESMVEISHCAFGALRRNVGVQNGVQLPRADRSRDNCPCRRQAALLSPFIASAVMATMDSVHREALPPAHLPRRLETVHLRHLYIHHTRSNVVVSRAAKASLPLAQENSVTRALSSRRIASF